MPLTPGRRVALDVLAATQRGRRLDLAFHEAAASAGLDDRARRFAQELAYGTIRMRGRLDHLLDYHLRKGLGSVSPAILDVLRLGAHQLLHMGGVPRYAAISQAVDEAERLHGRGAAALVTAVLNALADAGLREPFFPPRERDPAGFLATFGSHPRWLVDRWLERWSLDDVETLVRQDNQVPSISVLPLSSDPDEAVERLRTAGIDSMPTGSGTGTVQVTSGADVARVLEIVDAVVQDPAASLVARYVDPRGGLVADLCAAPGGKTLALSRTAGYVLAADRSFPRLALLAENVRRTGGRIGIVAALAERPPLTSADTVLVDVPCTGTGTLRRHPDARWRLQPSDLTALTRVQDRILRGAAEAVPPGGILVYSTCSLEPEENELRVEAFLDSRPAFRLEPPEGDAVDHMFLDGEGRLVVLPQLTGFDGAFAARMRRVE